MIKHYVLKNATKHWFSYVEALLVTVTDSKLNVFDAQNVRNVLRMFCGWVKSFHMKITANRVSFTEEDGPDEGLSDYKLYFDEVIDNIELNNTMLPTGLAKFGWLTSISICLFWQFHVDKYLKINFTVEYLHISSNDYEKCYTDSLIITDRKKPNISCSAYIPKDEHIKIRELHFCGKHSDILFFFRGLYQIGRIWSEPLKQQYISMRYSVMDSLNISMWTNQNYLVQPQRHILVLQDKKILASYHIQVSKLHIVQLQIKTVNVIVEIYDGPGVLSPKLNKGLTTSAVLLSTTFQVYLFLKTGEKTLPSSPKYIGLLITSVTRHDHQEFINLDPGRHSIVKYPNPKCIFSTFCSTFITANLNSFINATTASFVYNGHNSITCSIGGVTVFDFVNGTYKEMTTICTNQGINYVHRNIYSSTSTAILLFYFYQGYSSGMKVELNVSTTKCRKIIVDACQNNYDVSSFDIMFKNVTKQQRIQGKKDHKGKKKAEINCKIVQVVQKHEPEMILGPDQYKFRGDYSCATRVFPVLAERWNANITLSMTGFLGALVVKDDYYQSQDEIGKSIFFIKTTQSPKHDPSAVYCDLLC